MKFTVGYQLNDTLKKTVIDNKDKIAEIYFPWGNFTNGRGVIDSKYTQRQMEIDLDEYASVGFEMNLLLNGNCYGRYAQSRSFFMSIGDNVQELIERYKLGSITTTSPLIAKFVKTNFPDLEVRASVNMEVGSVEGMKYIAQWFDSFYLKREYNYNYKMLKTAYDWCTQNNKKLYLLANSGCLNYCSARTFHDNLVSHEGDFDVNNTYLTYEGQCFTFLKDAINRNEYLKYTNFIRPEDVYLY